MTRKETYDEMAARIDEQVTEGLRPEDFEPVKAQVSPTQDVIYSMRFSREDMAALRRHAANKGVKVSTFVRDAVIEALARDELVSREPAALLQQLAVTAECLQAVTRDVLVAIGQGNGEEAITGSFEGSERSVFGKSKGVSARSRAKARKSA